MAVQSSSQALGWCPTSQKAKARAWQPVYMRRRVAFWATVASPLLVMAVAFLLAGILELLGADCVTYGNNPMGLDNDTVCNELGDTQSGVGWRALVLAIILVPVALITGTIGAWRKIRRKSR